MANSYRLSIAKINGTGVIQVSIGALPLNPLLSTEQGAIYFILEGETVNISVTLDNGFVSFTTISQTLPGGPFSSSPFSFNMPSFDVRITFDISGQFIPIDSYGLKYFWDFVTVNDRSPRRLEIYEDGFGGIAEERRIQNISYQWGNFEQDPVDTIIGSKIVFDVIGEDGDFIEFLEGDNRKFKAILIFGTDTFFEGYMNLDRLRINQNIIQFPIQFEAVDGFNSFEAIRFVPQRTPSNRDRAIGNIIGALNQTFVDGRKVNVACDIYEDRMDADNSLFQEFLMPAAAIFNDGEEARFDDGTRIVNETLFISDVLKRTINPFLCNVFLWQNEWWVMGVREYAKSTKRVFRFNPDGTLDTTFNIDQDFVFSCPENSAWLGFDRNIVETNRKFTEFTSTLRLGVFDNAAEGGIFESKFDINDFFVSSGVGFPAGTLILRPFWRYVRAQPRVASILADNNVSDVAYVSNSQGEYVEIFKCTRPTGISDPDISYIELSSQSSALPISIVQENANTISFELEFMLNRNDGFTGIVAGQSFGLMIRIGDNWLSFNSSTNVFSWVGSENIMTFPINEVGVFNSVNIQNVVVPASDFVVIRLYQVINTVINEGPGQRTVKIGYRNLRLSVEQNEGLANSEIAYKSITDDSFSRVYDTYQTFIGDALTANSQSAIRLLDLAVSETWSDFESLSVPLQALQVQALANIHGRKALRVVGMFYGLVPNPTQTVSFDGKKWKITYIAHDVIQNKSEVVLFEVQ
jgi:hypothetical protein